MLGAGARGVCSIPGGSAGAAVPTRPVAGPRIHPSGVESHACLHRPAERAVACCSPTPGQPLLRAMRGRPSQRDTPSAHAPEHRPVRLLGPGSGRRRGHRLVHRCSPMLVTAASGCERRPSVPERRQRECHSQDCPPLCPGDGGVSCAHRRGGLRPPGRSGPPCLTPLAGSSPGTLGSQESPGRGRDFPHPATDPGRPGLASVPALCTPTIVSL